MLSNALTSSFSLELIQKKPRAIFIELESVFNFDKIDKEILRKNLVKHNFTDLNESIFQEIDNSLSIQENFNIIFGNQLSNEVYKNYLSCIISEKGQIQLNKKVVDILNYCHKKDIRLVILSNIDNQTLNLYLEQNDIQKLFDMQIDLENIKSAVETFEIHRNEETILFIGETLNDMKIAFQNKFIPIMINKETYNLQILQNINLENPIRLINDQNDFYELFEKSTRLWEKKREKTKIVYIGAGGNIGKQSIPKICDVIPYDVDAEIVLIGSGNESSLSRLRGFSEDISGSLNCCTTDKRKRIKFTVTNDLSNVSNSTIVLCSAGKWPSVELSNKFAQIDPTGRTKQSFINQSMIENIAEKVQFYSPDSLLVIATNQVDMMCGIARLKAPNLKVLGLSGPVDSARLKQIIFQDYGVDVTGLMIGFHNSSMIPLISSLKIGNKIMFPFLAEKIKLDDVKLNEEIKAAEKEKVDALVAKIRKLGPEIARMQKVGITDLKNNGASVLPSTSMAKLVAAYCFNEKIVESFNTFIKDKNVADHYGVQPFTALSIPLEIEKGKITQITTIPVTEYEKNHLRESQKEVEKEIKLLVDGHFIDLLKEK